MELTTITDSNLDNLPGNDLTMVSKSVITAIIKS